MRIDLEFQPGDRSKPAVIFIHGLGMDKNLWFSPCEARIGGGLFPFNLLMRKRPERVILPSRPEIKPEILTVGTSPPWLATAYHDLQKEAYPLVTWSQRRPVAPVDFAVEELKAVVDFTSNMTDKDIILVGHSRGGLIGRRYIETHERDKKRISALITVATPHRGSTMAEWVKYFSIAGTLLEPFLKYLSELSDEVTVGKVLKALRRISDFFRSEAIRELLPDSPFIKSLKPLDGIRTFSLAGTDPHLFSLYRWRMQKEDHHYILTPEEIFSFPGSIIPLLPERLIPPEWIPGRGDGLVALDSADFGEVSFKFNLNHGKILTDEETRACIVKIIREVSTGGEVSLH